MSKRVNVGLLFVSSAMVLLACDPSSSSSSGTGGSSGVVVPPGEAPPDVPSECAAPTGAGTKHGGSVQTETWTAADSPHILQYDTSIYGTLTIEPCAEVLLAKGSTVSVNKGASIVAKGEPAKRIHIGAQDPSTPFSRIRTSSGTLDLAYVTIDGGGDPLNTQPYLTGMLDISGTDQALPTQETIKVDHVKLAGSASNGIALGGGGGFAAGSTDLTITGSAIYPMSIWARASGTIPPGFYTGNTTDEILLPADHAYSDFIDSTTLHDRGVPYHVGHATSSGDLRVDAGFGQPAATLTIEPNVKMRFKKGGVFRTTVATGTDAPTGILVAVGTADKPIVFTSGLDSPAAGDWLGLTFGEHPSSKLDYVRVEYAGGATVSGSDSCGYPATPINDAAIRINGSPSAVFITNTTIANSASNGIDRGFRSDTKPTFLPTNIFENIAKCTETYPRDVSGACPTPVPCPTN